MRIDARHRHCDRNGQAEDSLAGTKLLIVDIEDGNGKVLPFAGNAADSCGAGTGDLVLLSMGSAARLRSGAGTLTGRHCCHCRDRPYRASQGGSKLLVVDVEDGAGNVLEHSLVAVDTCGTGVGDLVLVTMGSAARLSSGSGTLPLDAAIIAVIDHIELARRAAKTSSSEKRKK